ncbi:MAG: hypothetical protein R3E08_01685 [Thiotrichaceae bacterium]
MRNSKLIEVKNIAYVDSVAFINKKLKLMRLALGVEYAGEQFYG